jgi:hypothetical protein
LATRIAALTDALDSVAGMAPEDRPEVIIVERSNGGDACFARMLHDDGLIGDDWYSAYCYVKAGYERLVPDADGIIDMNVPVSVAMQRLRVRARGEEVSLPSAYQAHLYDTISGWLKTEGRPVLVLDPAEWEGKHADAASAAALGERVMAFAARITEGARGRSTGGSEF